MYTPTENERALCIDIVQEMLKNASQDECEEYADRIIHISYSIGGDFGEKTLRAIAKALLNK